MIPAPTTMTSYGLLGPPMEVPGDVCNRRRAAGKNTSHRQMPTITQRRVAAHCGSTLQWPSNGAQFLASRRAYGHHWVHDQQASAMATFDAVRAPPWQMLKKVCDFRILKCGFGNKNHQTRTAPPPVVTPTLAKMHAAETRPKDTSLNVDAGSPVGGAPQFRVPPVSLAWYVSTS
jgi:hypothetical protein